MGGSDCDLDIVLLVMESLTVSILMILFIPTCRGVTCLIGTSFLFRMHHYHRNGGSRLLSFLGILTSNSAFFCVLSKLGLYSYYVNSIPHVI